jgi:hypothetical protein
MGRVVTPATQALPRDTAGLLVGTLTGQALELDGSVAHRGKFCLLQPQSLGNRIAPDNGQL